ncbi:hypothetical protein DFH11DRAFT_1747795 [Phellopilus nigrolimitatus]|nr:hypothetical protein DFH11DRAFT_1747795 [Phellopilus nigrolimitatus]
MILTGRVSRLVLNTFIHRTVVYFGAYRASLSRRSDHLLGDVTRLPHWLFDADSQIVFQRSTILAELAPTRKQRQSVGGLAGDGAILLGQRPHGHREYLRTPEAPACSRTRGVHRQRYIPLDLQYTYSRSRYVTTEPLTNGEKLFICGQDFVDVEGGMNKNGSWERTVDDGSTDRLDVK